MRLGREPQPKVYNVSYLGKNVVVKTCDKIKINGIIFQRDRSAMDEENVKAVCSKMDSHLKRWSRRNLSILGKINIVKTFGISQIIYLMQSLCLKNAHMKVLKAFLYKFIWNRHYLAAKAPERIKREIVNTPVKLGGFGMLDIAHLDEGLKCRALGRLLASEHPFMILLRNKVDLNDFFDPKCISNVDSILESAINVLNRH